MDLVVGMRGHSNIVPFGLGTPVVGLGSHNKNRFFLAQIGTEHAMINTQNYPEGCSEDAMFDVLTGVLDDKTLSGRLKQRFAELTRVSEDFNARTVALLGN
jgi:polysaccharide pyruvyl transferase WcaK-like protein